MSLSKEKRKHFQYPAQNMQDAVDEVKSGALTAWAAAKKYQLPYQTLKDKIDGTHVGKVGVKCILSEEDETELAAWIKERAKMAFPLDKDELMDAAIKIAERRGDKQFAEQGF